MSEGEEVVRRRNATLEYRKKLLQHKELETKLRVGTVFANSLIPKVVSRVALVMVLSKCFTLCRLGVCEFLFILV